MDFGLKASVPVSDAGPDFDEYCSSLRLHPGCRTTYKPGAARPRLCEPELLYCIRETGESGRQFRNAIDLSELVSVKDITETRVNVDDLTQLNCLFISGRVRGFIIIFR